MKIHIITVGKPKLAYAQLGWEEYLTRLEKLHTVRVTHLADKFAYDATVIRKATDNSYVVALVIEGSQLSSEALAAFLDKRALESGEVSFIIGGPEGLPESTIREADYRWSLSELTFPHDLAMVMTLEALYRATTILNGYPYHKG